MAKYQNNRVAILLPFPYEIDPVAALAGVQDEAHPVLLHGTGRGIHKPNISILGVNPSATITVKSDRISTVNLCNSLKLRNESAVFTLANFLESATTQQENITSALQPNCFGRHGLAIGYFGYEWCTRFELSEADGGSSTAEPDAWWGFYSVLAIWDHQAREAWVVGVDSFSWFLSEIPDVELVASRLYERLVQNPLNRGPASSCSEGSGSDRLWNRAKSSFTRDAYGSAFEQILEHIRRGDVYQVNLTQQFSWTGHDQNPIETFARLYACNPAPYSAFLDIGGVTIHSTSPELFLKRRGRQLVTSPIKGTQARLGDDNTAVRSLLDSMKDGAEHIMIVDLERNDLGRICNYGTVRPERLRYIETLPALHHLVTDVVGELRPGVGLSGILQAMLPGGSITGAPKIRAMQVIREVEPVPRGVYTGCIGAIAPGGDFTLNIAIRTVVQTHDTISFGVGGGIVADSDPDAEYAECLLKGKNLLCACT